MRGWLKEEALRNISDMLVTEETSQEERLPLKAVAPRNMPVMSVTVERSGESAAL